VLPVLGLVGCGKMAYALMKGISSASSLDFDRIYVNDIDATRSSLFVEEFKSLEIEPKELIKASNIIIIAVKPHQVGQVLEMGQGLWNDKKLIVSIAAGIKTSDIEEKSGVNVPVVRVMPNTPCLVGSGAAAISAGRFAGVNDIELVKKIMDSVGISLQVDEKHMDAITAVSGSGPAYVYLVVESMINAGLQVGLDINLLRNLVFKTVAGSIKMLEETGEHPAVLREQVCSPGGTTIAGVRELEENGIRRAFFQAIEKACLRSVELGKDK
jgi:pyrroline-5-carboxylate reductase